MKFFVDVFFCEFFFELNVEDTAQQFKVECSMFLGNARLKVVAADAGYGELGARDVLYDFATM